MEKNEIIEEGKNLKEEVLKTNFKLVEVVLIVLICTIIGIIIGYSLTMKFTTKSNLNSNKLTADKELNEFIKTYDMVLNKYYKDVNKKELINSAINGMLSELDDPYSVFLDEESKNSFNERLNGNYKGIGIEISINENKEVYVLNVFPNTPAQKADIKTGDIFLNVNDQSVVGKTSTEISNMIKTSKVDNIKLILRRGTEELNKTVKLNRITLDSVKSEVIQNGNLKTGYIKIDIFASNTYTQFKTQLNNLEKDNINNLIIDVRDNSGGYLDVVTDMGSLFLPKNKILYKLEEKGKITNVYSKTKEERKYKIVVLTNEYSASASEILAAALKESYGATIVGVNTYGKGTVQQTEDLSTGGMLKFTTQKWLTPNGNWLNEKGLEPTVKEEITEAYKANPVRENDNQFIKALEILKN